MKLDLLTISIYMAVRVLDSLQEVMTGRSHLARLIHRPGAGL